MNLPPPLQLQILPQTEGILNVPDAKDPVILLVCTCSDIHFAFPLQKIVKNILREASLWQEHSLSMVLNQSVNIQNFPSTVFNYYLDMNLETLKLFESKKREFYSFFVKSLTQFPFCYFQIIVQVNTGATVSWFSRGSRGFCCFLPLSVSPSCLPLLLLPMCLCPWAWLLQWERRTCVTSSHLNPCSTLESFFFLLSVYF